MRTTVTLDDDLAVRLRDRAHELGIPFKVVINEAIRNGLDSSRRPRPYRLKTQKLGAPSVDLTKATRLAGQLEDDATVRRMRQGQ
jgi:hypothetical protein